MESNNNIETNDPYFSEVKSKTNISLDLALWFYRILKYWYLFIISVSICLGIAYIKNLSWVPQFGVEGVLMLEDRGNVGIVSGAVPLGNILRNTNNQQIVLRSYDIVQRTVKRLPKKMFIDYFRTTRFINYMSIYVNTPIEIEVIELQKEAHDYTYNIEYIDETKCRIFYEATETIPAFSIIAPYNTIVEDKLFKIRLNKTESFSADFLAFNFRFLSEDQLAGRFIGRINTAMKNDASSALVISMFGVDPSRDIDFLKGLLDEYEDYNLSLKNKQADMTLDFIEKQLKIITDSLNVTRSTLDNFQKETGVYALTSPSVREEIDVVDQEKEALAIKEKNILVITQKISESILGITPLIDPATFDINNGALSTYIKDYNAILESSLYLGKMNPLYNKTVDELNDSRAKILEELQIMQSKLQEEKDVLVKKYQLFELKLDNLPLQERELLKYERENRINEMYQQFLSQRRYEAQIQKASNTPDNFILEEPRLVTGAINGGEKSNRTSYFFFLGLVLPLVFVVLKEEVLKTKISTKEECENLSGLPVIGTIENVSKKLKNGVVLVKNYPKSSFAESFRNIRVRLEYLAQRETHISILVTSSEPADGKTFIATNIASVYQLTGKKVVIIDLDLRRPSVSKTLNIETHKGVSNYIIGQVTLEDIIIHHPDYGFDIIPAGTLPPNPSELIKTKKTRELIAHLKTIYDYVIIDCSPVGLVSDAYILSKLVDTTLFAVRRNKTNKSFFKSVTGQLRNDGVNNAALIFNDVKGREGYYGTARYYGDRSYYLKKSNYYHDDYFDE